MSTTLPTGCAATEPGSSNAGTDPLGVAPLRAELYRHALRLSRNHYDAEDLVQEAMARAYRSAHRYEPGTNERAWIHRIVLNTFLTFCRDSRHREVLYPADAVGDEHDQHRSPVASAEQEALELLGDDPISVAMRTLPVTLRWTLYAAYVQGYRCREIAAMTNTPIGTVMSRLHRGRTQLHAELLNAAN